MISGEEGAQESPEVPREEDAGLLGDEKNAERGGFRGRGNRGRGGFRGGFRKHKTDDEGFTVVKEEDGHQNHIPSRRQRGAFRGAPRGGFRGGEGRPRGGDAPQGEGRGGRGRGTRGGEKPWTAKEHRNRGEVRTTEHEFPAESHEAPSSAPEKQ